MLGSKLETRMTSDAEKTNGGYKFRTWERKEMKMSSLCHSFHYKQTQTFHVHYLFVNHDGLVFICIWNQAAVHRKGHLGTHRHYPRYLACLKQQRWVGCCCLTHTWLCGLLSAFAGFWEAVVPVQVALIQSTTLHLITVNMDETSLPKA